MLVMQGNDDVSGQQLVVLEGDAAARLVHRVVLQLHAPVQPNVGLILWCKASTTASLLRNFLARASAHPRYSTTHSAQGVQGTLLEPTCTCFTPLDAWNTGSEG